MAKRNKNLAKVPKRLKKAHAPAINMTDELKVAAEILNKQRSKEKQELEYALVTTTNTNEFDDVNNEFARECLFSEQAKQAAASVLPKLKKLGIPTDIPEKYNGDRVKSNHQMEKIKNTLKSRKESIEKSDKMKKLRDLKKLGKKIQEEVLRKRVKEKKEFLDQVKKRPVSELFD